MKPPNTLSMISSSLVGIVLSLLCWRTFNHSASISDAPVVLDVPLNIAVGSHPVFFGNPQSSCTLIEFGDYQCSPCRYIEPKVEQLLKMKHGQIRFVFRQYPLIKIHPRAYQAALASESSKDQGKFEDMHKGLFSTSADIRDAEIQQLVRKLKMDSTRFASSMKTTASATIYNDMEDAVKLGVEGTPTFILCDAKGRVIRLDNLAQVDMYVK